MKYEVELIADLRGSCSESPFWDEGEGKLYWVDINKRYIHVYDYEMKAIDSIDVHEPIGCVAGVKEGGLIAALQTGFHFIDKSSHVSKLVSNPESDVRGNRFNDGKCDAAGRLWAGTMSFDARPNRGALYVLDTDLTVTKAIGNTTISNGIGWSPDNKTMYYIDSYTQRIDAFDFGLEKGILSNRRTVITIPPGEGKPDGMCVDSEGMLWAACWEGGCVARYNPYHQKLIEKIAIPARQVASCCFGGPSMRELFITTAEETETEFKRKYPHAGGVFKVRTDTEGLKMNKFGD